VNRTFDTQQRRTASAGIGWPRIDIEEGVFHSEKMRDLQSHACA
jgi:hypothetical protein